MTMLTWLVLVGHPGFTPRFVYVVRGEAAQRIAPGTTGWRSSASSGYEPAFLGDRRGPARACRARGLRVVQARLCAVVGRPVGPGHREPRGHQLGGPGSGCPGRPCE